MKRTLRTDLDDILRHNLYVQCFFNIESALISMMISDDFSNKIDIMVERIEASNKASTDVVVYKMDISTTKVLDRVNDSTLVILHKVRGQRAP